MKASFERYVLKFKTPGGTSRGILKEKETFFIHIQEKEKKGTGECGLLRLSLIHIFLTMLLKEVFFIKKIFPMA